MDLQKTNTKQSRVRAARYLPDQSLIVASKTLGTNLIFDLMTENISRSGLLLSWDSSSPIPFIESTILEMTIDPSGKWLEHPVSCLGKVVRKEKVTEYGNRDISFGVSIVQIDEADLQHWESCVASLATRALPVETEEPANRIKSVRMLKQA